MSKFHKVMEIVGTDWCGSANPPESRTLYHEGGREVAQPTDESYVISSNNDGCELWFGTRHRWYFHMNQREVRLLFKYLLVDWYIKARWLGLRRPIYYWALHHEIASWKKRSEKR